MTLLAVDRPGPVSMAARSSPNLIDVRDVSIRFGALQVLEGMRLSIRDGEFVSLLGPSGCGKSTLLKAMGGLIPVSGGAIKFGSSNVRLGLMFQKPLLLPWRTALSNVLLPLELGGREPVSAEGREQAIKMLELVRLADFAHAYPHQLSGGMQQRAALARTLMQDPDVLLLDEPFGALDELTRDLLNEELIGIWKSGATKLRTIVMVTHSIPEAVAMSSRVFVLAPRPARLLDTVEIPVAHPRELESPAIAHLIKQTRKLVRGVL